MTALDERPPTPGAPRGTSADDDWEWHEFAGGDGWAHLYRRSELRGERSHRLMLLRPWCEMGRPYPLDHDRGSITRQKVIPRPGSVCPLCSEQNAARRAELPCPRRCGSGECR